MSKKGFVIGICLFLVVLIGLAVFDKIQSKKTEEGASGSIETQEEKTKDGSSLNSDIPDNVAYADEVLQDPEEEYVTKDSLSTKVADLSEYTIDAEDEISVAFEDENTVLVDGETSMSTDLCNDSGLIKGKYNLHIKNFMCLSYKEDIIEKGKSYAVLRYKHDFDEENLDDLDYNIENNEILVDVDSLKGQDIEGKEVDLFIDKSYVDFVTYPYSVLDYMDIVPVVKVEGNSRIEIKG